MNPAAATVAYFGKLSNEGDFVRANASSPAALAFDEWVQEGMQYGRQRVAGWSDRYPDAQPLNFVFPVVRGERCLLGVLWPSRDRSGRQYPLMVFAQVPSTHEPGDGWQGFPQRFAAFFSGAHRLAATAVQQGGRDTLKAGVDTLTPLLHAAVSSYRAFTRSTAVQAWADTLGWTAGAWPHLERLVLALAPEGNDATDLHAGGIRLPLSGNEQTMAQEVSFWADLCTRAAACTAACPFLFWPRAPDAHPSELFLYISRPPPAALSRMLLPTLPDEQALILHASSLSEPADPDIHWTYPPDVVLDTLLAHVSQTTRR